MTMRYEVSRDSVRLCGVLELSVRAPRERMLCGLNSRVQTSHPILESAIFSLLAFNQQNVHGSKMEPSSQISQRGKNFMVEVFSDFGVTSLWRPSLAGLRWGLSEVAVDKFWREHHLSNDESRTADLKKLSHTCQSL